MPKPANLPLDHPAWKVAHTCYLDAVSRQSDKLRDALDEEIGDAFDAFFKALADGLLVISSHFLDDGLNYVIRVWVADGQAPLARIHASRLGLNDTDTQLAELLNGA
ncbi:MAG: hypothetical protein IPL43_04130 [Micropruina sp.]|nr:hypothetical protein [Micropruina sp.]